MNTPKIEQKSTRTLIQKNMAFVILTSVIFLSGYLCYIFTTNIIQAYIFKLHLNSILVPHVNIVAQRISLVVIFLCTLKSLQSVERQRWLMLALMLCLVIALLIPTTLTSFPLIPGFSSAIFDLTEPWRQLYAPPAWRATIEGITEGLAGIMDLSSVATENHFIPRLFYDKHYFGVFYTMIMFALFIKYTSKLQQTDLNDTQNTQQSSKSIRSLLTEYPYIFIICLFSGFNNGIFSYTFLLAKEVLPNFNAQYYQYIIYIGSIFCPILIGWLADKKGIFFMVILIGFSLAVVNLLNAMFFLTQLPYPTAYYVLAFLDGGFCVSIWTLSVALIGERLRIYGIFRAFALSNFIFGIGMLAAGRVYGHFVHSFSHTKLTMGTFNLIVVGILFYFYRKPQNQIA